MSQNFEAIKKEIQKFANKKRADFNKKYFKTGKGEYGEGDLFLGLTVPEQRKIAKLFQDLEIEDVKRLLKSKIHEHRFIALVILIHKFNKQGESKKKEIVDIYLSHTKYINNWDLVDASAEKILGQYLLNKSKYEKKVLYDLARSKSLWEKRISIIATFAFIKNRQFNDCLKISEILLEDSHDLIHKAVGWMLREIGKRDMKAEESFLKKHYKKIPRTMLRYAIEKFSREKKDFYMQKNQKVKKSSIKIRNKKHS